MKKKQALGARSDAAPKLNYIRDCAVEAAQEVGKILSRHFRGKLKISEKPGQGLVTNVDLKAQDKAVGLLRKAFPTFGFLTEESEPELSDGPGRWIIDPLDGTTNYVHGFPMFCVSIAAEWNHEMVVGVIHHPILNETFVGVRGKGATLNNRRIQVSKTDLLQNSLLTTGFTYQKSEFLKMELGTFERLSGRTRAIRRPGSAALDLAYTAAGVFDGFWERRLSPWDVAAGALIVEEAGGKVTDFQGKPFQIEARELLATNLNLHSALLGEVGSR